MTTPGSADRLAAVIGRPVRHSLSPAIHTAAFEERGLNWAFTRFEIVDGGVADAIGAMAPLGIAGYAVTMPHKQAAATAVDEVDPAAAALGAVNTVVLRDDGSTFGASTDGAGFVASLLASGVDPEDADVVVVGAGGAARSIIDALARAGAAQIVVVNRTSAAAEEAATLAPGARVGDLTDIRGADIVVNTTSVGMGTSETPFDPTLLSASHTVADIVYHPLETELLRSARRAGAQTVDGLGMLVHQAILQQELWTGSRPDAGVMRAAAERTLATA